MKNLNTNESTSFESSLGSPTKPLQPNEVQKPKQLFFVNNIEETPQPLLNTIINPWIMMNYFNYIHFNNELKCLFKIIKIFV